MKQTKPPSICEECHTKHTEGLFLKDGKLVCSQCKYGSPMRQCEGAQFQHAIGRYTPTSVCTSIDQPPDLQWHDKHDR